MLSERKKKLYENRPPEGAKPARGGSKMASGRLFCAKAARGALLAGCSWAASWGSFWDFQGLIWMIWTMSVALRETQQKHYILHCFWASCLSSAEVIPHYPNICFFSACSY